MTLLETSIVLIIAASALAAGASIYGDYLNNRTNQITADEITKVSGAYGRYLKDNYGATVIEVTNAGGVLEVPIQRLKDQGYLLETFQDLNPYGQTYHLVSRIIPATSASDSDRLESVVYTSGGEVIPAKNAQSIASLVGAGGGYTMPTGNTQEVKSTFGGFSLDMGTYSANPGNGKLVSAMFFSDEGSLVADFLYRNVIPGRPDLNTMNASINMDRHDVSNAGQVTSQTANISDTLTANNTAVTGKLAVGGGSLTGSNALDVNGTTQLRGALGVGGATVAGQMLAVTGNARISGNAAITGTSTLTGAVGVGRAPQSGYALSVSGNTNMTGTLTTSGAITASGKVRGQTLMTNLTATEGASCSGYTTGEMAKTSAGVILSCQGGKWTGIGGGKGLKGIFKPLAGKTIACGPYTVEAKVLADGTPQFCSRGSCSSNMRGSVPGYSGNYEMTTSGVQITLMGGGDAGNSTTTFCQWPLT